jgi:hypothetical protein
MPAKKSAGEIGDVSKGPSKLPPPITVNPAEFLALRAIVLALVHEMARTQERTGGGDAQRWTNELSATCQDAITGTEINVEDRDPQEIRREAKREVNNILRGLRFRSPERS